MASSVAQPLERQFAQIPGIAQMTSTSYLGTAAVTIQFDLNRNIDGAANDVQGAINAASGQLPKNLPSPPTYRKVNPADSPILLLSATSDTLPLTTVSDSVDAQLAQQISQISGVAQVTIGGQQKPAIRDPDRSGETGGQGPVAGRRPQPDRDHHRRQPERQYRRRNPRLHDLRQRPVARIPRTGTTSSSPIATAARCGSAISARPSPGPKTPSRPPGPTASAACSWWFSSSPAPTSSTPSTRSRRLLPRLVAAIPPAIKIDVISDRTQTIRAAVEDVQFTLLLTIALVVMVIFIFLRSFWATVIPTVTVPLALLGACALMWVFGYTLDNLSLMALTIAVGFVVDDAIVMLENITRYIEEGEKPLAAAFKGAQRNRLHHRVDQHFAGRGADPAAADGRHHRAPVPRIRGHADDDDLRLDGGVADADADDGVALPARAPAKPSTASFYQWSERAFDAMLRAYERGLDLALRWRFTTLASSSPRSALSVYLFVIIPEGLLPAAGRRPDHRHLRSRPGHLLCRNEAAAGSTRQDRAGRSRRRNRRDERSAAAAGPATTATCSSR